MGLYFKMKLFRTSQVAEIDKYTIQHEPISSLDLMDRAGSVLFDAILDLSAPKDTFFVIAGPGNNGGDALNIAWKLAELGRKVKVLLASSGKLSADCQSNLSAIQTRYPGILLPAFESEASLSSARSIPFPEFSRMSSTASNAWLKEMSLNDLINDSAEYPILIDGLFGAGLSRPLSGDFEQLVVKINELPNTIISIDTPSGLLGEDHPANAVAVKASYTLSLQFPKLSFFMPENEQFTGIWSVLDIALHPMAIQAVISPYYFTQKDDVQHLLKKRTKFSHKGTFGHALLIAGRKDMAGASVLSAEAVLRSGVGLLTLRGPECNRIIIQRSVPEAIFSSDVSVHHVSDYPVLSGFKAVGIGCGLGTEKETGAMLVKLLKEVKVPLVIDADALNLLSSMDQRLGIIPANSILTPHPGEFDRLSDFYGLSESKVSNESSSKSWIRMDKAHDLAAKLGVFILLKGAYTQIHTPDGECYFNSTGNPGMATAGSGDVLTGILTALLCQGYEPLEACKLGAYLHGLAGDLAAEAKGEISMIASDILQSLPAAFKLLG